MNELDEAKRRAIDMIQFFQEQCKRQCAPYFKILADIHSLSPHVIEIDRQTFTDLRQPPTV